MRGIASVCNDLSTVASQPRVPLGGWGTRCLVIMGVGAIASCTPGSSQLAPRSLPLTQTWDLQPGSQVAGYSITGGLGDISIQLNGAPVYAPFDGTIEPLNAMNSCWVFTSDDLPAYLFRLCGLSKVSTGTAKAGDPLGRGHYLQFAVLRQQPDGTWAMVEPSPDIIERVLQRP